MVQGKNEEVEVFTRNSLVVCSSEVATKKKVSFLKLPNGTLLRLFLISRCTPLENGVGVFNSQDVMIGFIETTDDVEKSSIIDILTECMYQKSIIHPNWDFLKK